MENLFFKYMKERTARRKVNEADELKLGPVMTISREYGCPAREIAYLLADTLTKKNKDAGIDKEWRVISKEIIEESARELKVSPALMDDISRDSSSSFFESLTTFFSDNYYPGSSKVKNTIAKFIYETAAGGNVIIVGRAGEAITKNIKRSFHSKIIAPLDWRAREVSRTEFIPLSEAKKKCIEEDKRREQFRHYFEGDKPDVEFFNVTFNYRDMTREEIVEMLVIVAEIRGFV
ncbi:MAG: cytidylate kinase-like family protein [Chlorobi bacterium]|nr:cytidylate kinase-like family protein [Chlorobiota bacterium]